MNEPQGPAARGQVGLWIGIAMLLIGGVLLIRAAIVHDPGLRVPPFVAYVAAGVFFVGALAVFRQRQSDRTSGALLASLILMGLAFIGAWIALSPDSGGCSVGASGGAEAETSGLGCRIPFGIGALVTAVAGVVAAAGWWRSRRR